VLDYQIPQPATRNPQFFDAHCDTVMRIFDGGLDFVGGQGRAHIDLPRLLTAGYCVQLFAIFAPASQYPDRDLSAFADDIIAEIRGWVEASGDRIRLVTEASHIQELCLREGVVGALLGMEGADPLEGRAENLAHFHQLGLRSLIPAWSDNAFSGTCMGSGGPLTEEGAKLIELAEGLRVMVDVSHLSDAAFDQVCQITGRPFVASHSNCREICPSPRNLTDEQIRALAARGGVMGINLSADFLAPDYMVLWDAIARPAYAAARQTSDPAEKRRIRDETQAKLVELPLPPAEWIARHVRHAMGVGGEDCIGLGGDLDGIITMPVGITGAESYPAVADLLAAAGLTAAQVEKVCWRNMARVYSEVLG
jgi:membrane dipeptidase